MKSEKDLLLTYVKYNLWANSNLTEVFKTIDQSWLDKEIKSSFSSIRKTAFHIWDAEYIWLCRFQGVSLSKFPSKELPADTSILKFLDGAKNFLEFVEKQNDDFFEGKTTFKDISGTEHTMENSGIIFHIMNHSSFHRGQLVTMLRNLGFDGKMPRTDMIIYLRE